MRIKLVLILLLGCLCILSTPAFAASFVMTATNAGNYSSFNMDVNWSPTGMGVPSAGNTYSTMGWLMRSPANGTGYLAGDFTFAGDSLTVGGGNGAAAPFWTINSNGTSNNNSLIYKLSGQNLTVNNLILDGGTIRDGLGDNNTWSLNGNIYVTATGGGFIAQALGTINSAISGPGPIYIGDQGNTGTARGIFFTSASSTYAGNIYLQAALANRSRLVFSDDSIMNFAIGANGVNNSISGVNGIATFNGDFKFLLDGASQNIGDTWTVASVGSQTFSDTFTVKDFTADIGGILWTKAIDVDKWYQFSESDGKLTVVPEPATWILLILGAMGIAFYSRKK